MDQHFPHRAVADEAGTPLAIALVDPDDVSRRALHLLLSGQRHRVRSYDSPATLAEDPKAAEADWLIVAMRPGADDLSAVARLRLRGWHGRLAVIAEGGHLPPRDGETIGEHDLILTHPVAPHDWRLGLTH